MSEAALTEREQAGPGHWGLTERFFAAVAYAIAIHAAQRRKGTELPYFSHLLGACALVVQDGGNEDEAIAALLHDAAEDAGGQRRLDDIERRFGVEVATIAAGCTDTLEDPKPPWCPRKKAYIARLPGEPPSMLRVSVADKLDNARAILLDYRVHGEQLWERFDPESDQLWYYRSLVSAFRTSPNFHSQLIDELDRVVTELERLVAIAPR